MVASTKSDVDIFRSNLADAIRLYYELQGRLNKDHSINIGLDMSRLMKRSPSEALIDSKEMQNLKEKTMFRL